MTNSIQNFYPEDAARLRNTIRRVETIQKNYPGAISVEYFHGALRIKDPTDHEEATQVVLHLPSYAGTVKRKLTLKHAQIADLREFETLVMAIDRLLDLGREEGMKAAAVVMDRKING